MNATPDRSLEHEREIFLAALERRTPGERAAFLDGACGADASLRARLSSLLLHHTEDDFLEEVAPGLKTVPSAKPVPEADSGCQIGRYKLLQKIGEGGC